MSRAICREIAGDGLHIASAPRAALGVAISRRTQASMGWRATGKLDIAGRALSAAARKVFSHVVLALMLTGIAYASYIAVTYWTGISV